MLIGFEKQNGSIIEILPIIDTIQTQKQQRKLFFKMLSNSTNIKLKNKDINLSLSIFDNILNKIISDIKANSIYRHSYKKISKFTINDTILINNFFYQINKPLSKNYEMQPLLSSSFTTHTALLLRDFFDGTKISMMIDIESFFINYVLENIKLKNKAKNIYKTNNAIIIDNGIQQTKIYTKWLVINANDITSIKEDIQEAINEINNQNIKQIYLVYPKNQNFTKHIIITSDNLDGRLKLIPYSFRQLAKSA